MNDKPERKSGQSREFTPGSIVRVKPGRRLAVMKGQDRSRWTDIYHAVLNAPWWAFFLGLAAFFATINVVFALFYLAEPGSLEHARRGNFWDAFLFSVQTIGSTNYTVFSPQTIYANIVVCVEAFFGILTIALFTGIIFARFSRPYARVVFSKVAVITPFDGVPTLMFRAANQRGNQILDAAITLTVARNQTTTGRHDHAPVRGTEARCAPARRCSRCPGRSCIGSTKPARFTASTSTLCYDRRWRSSCS